MSLRFLKFNTQATYDNCTSVQPGDICFIEDEQKIISNDVVYTNWKMIGHPYVEGNPGGVLECQWYDAYHITRCSDFDCTLGGTTYYGYLGVEEWQEDVWYIECDVILIPSTTFTSLDEGIIYWGPFYYRSEIADKEAFKQEFIRNTSTHLQTMFESGEFESLNGSDEITNVVSAVEISEEDSTGIFAEIDNSQKAVAAALNDLNARELRLRNKVSKEVDKLTQYVDDSISHINIPQVFVKNYNDGINSVDARPAGTAGFAVGSNAYAASYGVAIGASASAASMGSVAIGRTATARANSVVIGQFIEPTFGTEVVAMGYNIKPLGSNVSGQFIGSTVWGGPQSTVIGSSVYGGSSACVVGKSIDVRGTEDIAFGRSIAAGAGSTFGSNAVLLGKGITAGTGCVAVGSTISLGSLYSPTNGALNPAYLSQNAIALGSSITAGSSAIAIGRDINVNWANAFGSNLTYTGTGDTSNTKLILGRYNYELANTDRVVIAAGTAGSRRNLLVSDGSAMYVRGIGGFTGQSTASATPLHTVIANKSDKVGYTGTMPTAGIAPNTFYNLGTVSENKTITLASGNRQDEYIIQFSTPQVNAPTITWPSDINWLNGELPELQSSKTYLVSIVNKLGVWGEF